MNNVNISSDGKVEEKLKYWISKLWDMGRRNRLLFFKDTRSSTIIINEPDPLEVFEIIVEKGKPVFAPDPQKIKDSIKSNQSATGEIENETTHEYERKFDEFISNKSISDLNRVLLNLRNRSRTIREEQGFNALYMTFGMLKWKDRTDAEINNAPIILIPIDIIREGLGARLRIKMFEDEIVLNPALQLKLSKDFEISLNKLDDDLTKEDLNEYWNYLNEKVKNFYGWEVMDTVAIGIFNFQTLMIIKDLEENLGHYSIHPIIRMLSGYLENLITLPDDLPTAKQLDEEVSPFQVNQILDADSSQQEAIEAAKRGVSFVLQGPPGTGKSQTIANIIAESLISGKKVLFVSQKSVALDVVYKRLSAKGLGEFCLEVHSYKKNKKDVIQELGKSLNKTQEETRPDNQTKKGELLEIRKELNLYVAELHKPRFGMQMSLFQVLGEISYYSDNPSVKFSIDGIEQFSPEKYQHCISLIRKLQTYDEIINNIDQFIWKGYLKDSSSIKDREDISGNFEELANTINEFCSRFQSIASSLNINIPKNLRDCFELNSVISIFKPSIFKQENQELIRRIISKYDSILRVIRPQYWRDRNELSLHYWSDVTLPFDEEKEKLALVEKIISESKDMDLLPNDNTSLTKIEVDSFQETSKRITVLYKFSLSLFKEREIPEEIRNFLDNEFETTAEWYRDMSTQTDLIPEWINFRKVIEEAEDFGLGDFIDNILEKKIGPLLWEFTFKRRFFILLEDAIFQSNKILREFRSSTQKSLLDQFRKLDKELIELASKDIRSNLYKNRPEQTWVKADSAETVILRKEINRLRPIKPLRKLFKEIPNLLLDIKPCLMMSPLTVSQLIDPNTYKFDIAIFDEASQIPPEYAVGTIMRADQVVIAGDRYQLPPTRFFQTIDTDEFDEDDYDLEEYESVLNACDVIKIPNKMLLWHYRSEDESLITFSNYNFYDNRLLTFPTANGDDKSTGLEFIYVPEGIYRRGKGARDNPKEAEKVAELVFKHLQEYPEHTIGIVAFSLSQRRAIEMQIDKLKLENPHLYPLFNYNREEEVFIKNLETVQGDERDVIFFSVGYGKDETGNMSMNFGPLNRQGGERRLNVAVTRARKSVKLISSIQPEDIDLSRTQSDGARLLRSYLKTAKYGPDSVFEDETYDPNAEFGSVFEESVYEALTKRGIQLRKQVGVSNYRIDFGVVDSENPGRYLLGIECDGATYHSTPTARDRDRLRQELLEEKFGWRIHRIWSLDWVNNPIREIDKVLSEIEKSKEIGPRKPVKKN